MNTSILDLFKLDGQVALITGGNRGLGLAMAKALAEAGANISIAARDKAENSKRWKRFKAVQQGLYELPCDVTIEGSKDAVKETIEHFGKLIS